MSSKEEWADGRGVGGGRIAAAAECERDAGRGQLQRRQLPLAAGAAACLLLVLCSRVFLAKLPFSIESGPLLACPAFAVTSWASQGPVLPVYRSGDHGGCQGTAIYG